jgi:hypothetical protein
VGRRQELLVRAGKSLLSSFQPDDGDGYVRTIPSFEPRLLSPVLRDRPELSLHVAPQKSRMVVPDEVDEVEATFGLKRKAPTPAVVSLTFL